MSSSNHNLYQGSFITPFKCFPTIIIENEGFINNEKLQPTLWKYLKFKKIRFIEKLL